MNNKEEIPVCQKRLQYIVVELHTHYYILRLTRVPQLCDNLDIMKALF